MKYFTKYISIVLCLVMVATVLSVSFLYSFGLNGNFVTTIPMNSYDPDGAPEEGDYENERDYLWNLNTYANRYTGTQNTASISAYDPRSAVTVTANHEYTVSGLPVSNTIQNFHIGVAYIYITQKHYSQARGEMDVYISRALMSGNTATVIDCMLLKGFGHNQILTPYDYNGNAYFWIGLKPCPDYTGTSECYATQIGRIQYSANREYTSYGQVCRFGYLNYANDSNTNMGKVKRVDAALSTDKSKLLIGVRTYGLNSNGVNEDKKIVYSVYDNEVLNQALDVVDSDPTTNLVIFKDNSVVQNACYYTVVQNGRSNFILPNRSCQGLEFSGGDSIYISGGAKNVPGTTSYIDNYKPKICKMIKSGNGYPTTLVRCVSISGDNLGNIFNDNSEIEGLQLKGDNIYFAITGTYGASTTQNIYSISKSVMSSAQVS